MITVELPLRTKNPMNSVKYRNWHYVAALRKRERTCARLLTQSALVKSPVTLPMVVTMTRLSVGKLDFDGVVSALKSVRDGIADAIGVDDDDESGLTFAYAQERCKRGVYGVRVQIEGKV